MSVGSIQDVGKQLLNLRLVAPTDLEEVMADLGNPTPKELLSTLERQSLLTSFQVQKFEKGETTGYFFGRFKVLYLISAGTFARVFRAIDPFTGEGIAVKVLRTRHGSDPDMVRQFERESKLAERFQHPNIVRVLEAGVDSLSGQYYIAMEFVEGGSFREFFRIRKKFEPAEMIRLGLQLVEGLRYALSLGITHRDIKPTNILIASSGDVKWIDFGLGGTIEGEGKSATFSTEQRSVDYAGLEKTTGAPKGDPRSDIFFLGTIFYEMLSGESPITDTKDRQMRMARSRFEQINSLAMFEGIPKSLVEIVDKMLAFRPEDRYQNYDEILRDLRNCRLGGAASDGNPYGEVAEPPRVMIVHQSQKVQGILRSKLAEYGYQVALMTDIDRAMTIFKLKPSDCVIVDLDTTNRHGIDVVQQMQRSAESKGRTCGAVFLATKEQEGWIKGFSSPVVTLAKPLTLGPVFRAIADFAPPVKARER